MQRWEYRVVSWAYGTYTSMLNQYAADGWELVTVTSDAPEAPAAAPAKRSGIPMPRALGQLEDAAAKLRTMGESQAKDAPGATSDLLWVLRRPLPAERPKDDPPAG